jgi:hypothetical protein
MPDTRTARIELDGHGVVRVRINDGALQSLADAKENLAGQTLIDAFLALALLVDASPFGRMFGNVYLRIANPAVPTRLFSDETEVAGWLDGYRR